MTLEQLPQEERDWIAKADFEGRCIVTRAVAPVLFERQGGCGRRLKAFAIDG